MTCECDHLPGCGCSRCHSPAVETNLLSGEAWDPRFSSYANVRLMSGNSFIFGDWLTFTFRIIPGTLLTYHQVWFYTFQDWPVGAAYVFRGDPYDGVLLNPWDVIDDMNPDGEDFYILFDPVFIPDEGDYTFEIIDRQTDFAPVGTPPRETPDHAEDNVLYGEVPIAWSDESRISYLTHPSLYAAFSAGSAVDVSALVEIATIRGAAGLYWMVEVFNGASSFDSNGDPIYGTGVEPFDALTFQRNGFAYTPGNVVGPAIIASPDDFKITFNPFGMVDQTWYSALLRLTGYGDALGATPPTNRDYVFIIAADGEFSTLEAVPSTDPVERGTPFNLTLTAKQADGTTDLAYQGDAISLWIDGDAGDSLNITDYQSRGLWNNGVLVINGLDITGGSGTDTTSLTASDAGTGQQAQTSFDVEDPVVFAPVLVNRGTRVNFGVFNPWPSVVTNMQAQPWSFTGPPAPPVTGQTECVQSLGGGSWTCRISCVVIDTSSGVGLSVQTFGFTVDEPFGGWNRYEYTGGSINVQANATHPPPNTWAWADGGPTASFVVGAPGTPVIAVLSAPVVLSNYLYMMLQYDSYATVPTNGVGPAFGYRYMIQTATMTIDGIPVT